MNINNKNYSYNNTNINNSNIEDNNIALIPPVQEYVDLLKNLISKI